MLVCESTFVSAAMGLQQQGEENRLQQRVVAGH